MRIRFLNKAGLAMLAIVTGGLGVAHAQKAQKIEFTEPATENPVLVSNLSKINPNESTFKQVKEDLLRPFSSLDPKNALEMPDLEQPLPRPQRLMQNVLSKHAQELLDKKRNWAFTSYEELFMKPVSAEEMFGVKQYDAEGRDKNATSVMDRYYEGLEQKPGTTNFTTQDEMDNADNARAEFINRNGFDPLGKPLDANDPFIKKVMGREGKDDTTDKEIAGQVLGANGGIGSPADIRTQQKQLDRLDAIRRSILGDVQGHSDGPGGQYGGGVGLQNNVLDTGEYYSQKNKSPADSLLQQEMSDASGLKQKASSLTVVDPTANVLHSHVNDDLTARALGLPNPTHTNSVTRPAPTAQSISAEWDPFGANRMKPKF